MIIYGLKSLEILCFSKPGRCTYSSIWCVSKFIQKTKDHKEKYFFKVPFKTFSITGLKPVEIFELRLVYQGKCFCCSSLWSGVISMRIAAEPKGLGWLTSGGTAGLLWQWTNITKSTFSPHLINISQIFSKLHRNVLWDCLSH